MLRNTIPQSVKNKRPTLAFPRIRIVIILLTAYLTACSNNYSILLDSAETDVALGISQLSPETGQRSKFTAIVTHDGVLNFSILEEMDARLMVRGPVEDAPYTITITQTYTAYAQPDWQL